jgi:cell division protein FtsL
MKNFNRYKVRRERDPIPWRYSLLVFICLIFLASGFIYAAKKHFLAVDYSIKNERLQKEIEELENQQRQLKFQREVAVSPAEIEKIAKKMGFRKTSSENILINSSESFRKDKRDDKNLRPNIARANNETSSRQISKKDSKKKSDDDSSQGAKLADNKNLKFGKTGTLRE